MPTTTIVKLSTAMQDALAAARKAGPVGLYRWQGGFWSPTPPAGADGRPPEVYFGSQTIETLLDRGLLAVTEFCERGDPAVVVLTQAANAA